MRRLAISLALARACTPATSAVKSWRKRQSAPHSRWVASALWPWPTRTPKTNAATPAASDSDASQRVTRAIASSGPAPHASVSSVPRSAVALAGHPQAALGQMELEDLDQALGTS